MTSRNRFALIGLALFAGLAQAAPQNVVISQVYGGGGNSLATYRQDFVELFNGGTTSVNLSGWSVQYASAAGASWQVTNLSGSIAPGQFYLVRQGQGAGGTIDLPTADATGTILMSATTGKVALVAATSALTVANPSGGALEDLVGFGTANGFEGAVATGASNTAAIVRTTLCSDSNNNATDFAAATPTPRNSASPAQPCGGNVAIVPQCPARTAVAGSVSQLTVTASDADNIVNAAALSGTVPAGFSLASFTQAPAVGASATAVVSVDATVAPGAYSVQVDWRNDGAQNAQCTVTVNVTGLSRIFEIQGNGAVSPKLGLPVTTRGVVTHRTNNGFFIQDPTGDGDPATSDGIFVFSSPASVAVGQLVEVSATVAEFNVGATTNIMTAARPLTELVSMTKLSLLGSGYSIASAVVSLPEAVDDDLERFEGMLVTLTGPLTVGQNFFQGRFGEITLSANGRVETPTNRLRPGPDALAMASLNARRTILLDDGTSLQNPTPTPYIGIDNTLRAGDTVTSITGVIDFGLTTSSNADAGEYRIQPTQAVSIARTNPRTATPPSVGGNVRVASANVLNFFTTINDGSNVCPPSNTADDCRGANSVAELTRQRAKLVAELAAIDADVVGLMEMQNNGATAVQNLVDALNAVVGAGTWARVPDPAFTGTDAIKVTMIYKPARLTRVGNALSDTNTVHNRPPMAQTFAAANGERFTLVVNHFKSKGCTGAAGVDDDQGDLQGCFNARRVQQAQALSAFIAALLASSGSPDVLVVGDLNAYAKEDPVVALTDAGLVDLVDRFNSFGYSYVFDGAAGRLDHALASASLAAKATGTAEWHVNADEPSVIDYNLEFKQPACATCAPDLYTATPYRSSDHDPVIVGLSLVKRIDGTAGRDTIIGTPGDDLIEGGAGADLLTGGAGRDVFVYRAMRDAGDTITDFVPGTDRLDLDVLLASLGVAGSDAVGTGVLRLVDTAAGLSVQIDADGSGPGLARPLVTLRGVRAAQIVAARDLTL